MGHTTLWEVMSEKNALYENLTSVMPTVSAYPELEEIRRDGRLERESDASQPIERTGHQGEFALYVYEGLER